jgi:hypothetical protein
MEVEIPTGGQCFVASGSTSYYNYINNTTRDRYYLVENKMIRANRDISGYGNYDWSNYHCIQQGEILYTPELQVYFNFMAFTLISFCIILLYLIILKRFIK